MIRRILIFEVYDVKHSLTDRPVATGGKILL